MTSWPTTLGADSDGRKDRAACAHARMTDPNRLFPVEGVDQQNWSVEQLPVTLGDDSDLAVDDGDGGLVVDGVARHVERGRPALRVG